MENKIKSIIDKATELKKSGISDLYIAKLVHIELGKILIYDNNYTANFNKEDDKEPTQITKDRQAMILGEKTDIFKKSQVCRGMAEIYVAILNKIGINSKVMGIEKKGDVEGALREDGTIIDVPEIYDCSLNDNLEIITGKNEKSNGYISNHYCAMVEIDGIEYIQDFLIDSALFRIKVGEASINDSIPGFCLKENYESRAKQSLPLAPEYIEKIQSEYEKYTNEPNTEQTFQFLFEQLKRYDKDFGFEESKDFFLSISKRILPKDFNPQNLKIVNLLKESQSTCDIISIYNYNGINYLLRGGAESTSVKYDLGQISVSQIETLISQGFETRKKSDELTLNDSIIGQSNISMKAVVSNAITQGITIEDVARSDNEEYRNRNMQEFQIEGVTKDD